MAFKNVIRTKCRLLDKNLFGHEGLKGKKSPTQVHNIEKYLQYAIVVDHPIVSMLVM